MPSGRTTPKAVLAAAVLGWCALAHAGAQTCTVNSAASGPLSCTVVATVTATIHMPALVSVRATSVGTEVSAGDVALGITANTAYALELASSADSGFLLDEQSSWLTSRAPSHRVVILPTRRSAPSDSMGHHSPELVAFAPGPRHPTDRPRVILTIVAR